MTQDEAIRKIVIAIMKERYRAGPEKLMTLVEWETFIRTMLNGINA